MLHPSQIKSLAWTFVLFMTNANLNVINDQEYNLYNIVRFSTLIMSEKGNGTLNLIRTNKESGILIRVQKSHSSMPYNTKTRQDKIILYINYINITKQIAQDI